MGGDDWRDTGAPAGGYIGVASVVWICRLDLSFVSVVGGGEKEKGDGCTFKI